MRCEKCNSSTFIIHITCDHAKLCAECYEGDMSLREKQSRFAYLVSLLIQHAYENGYELTFGDAYAKSGHCINSYHYRRLAIDFNLFKDGEYLTDTEDHKFLGEFWESLDPKNRWGGRFKDGNHYEHVPEGWR